MSELINNIKLLPKYLTPNTLGTGTVAAVMACTGPMLIVITAARNGNLSTTQIISWLFGIYFIGGLIGIILPLMTGMPIAGAWSIPSAVLMSQALTQFSFREVVGAYIIAGLIIFLIGFLGWYERLVSWLPVELVMAVLAGSMIHLATDMIKSISSQPLIGGLTLLTYFFFTKHFVRIPAVVGAIAASLILYISFGEPISMPELTFQLPTLWLPAFSPESVLAVSVPITVMLLGTEGAQGLSVLKNAGYKPPVSLITMINGIGTMLAAVFGGHSACMAGIMTALCSSKEAGEHKGRYAAAFVSGIWMCIFGFFASVALGFIFIMPQALIKLIAGLALINVLISSLQRSFNGTKFQLGAFFTLAIALSGLSFYGISSAFWSLVGGWLVSWFFENKDFKQRSFSSQISRSEAA